MRRSRGDGRSGWESGLRGDVVGYFRRGLGGMESFFCNGWEGFFVIFWRDQDLETLEWIWGGVNLNDGFWEKIVIF